MTLAKAEMINQIAQARGYSSYLEICTSQTGGYYRDIEHDRFNPCHRLMYRCPDDFSDGYSIDFRSPDLEINALLDQIVALGTRYDIVFVDPWHLYETSLRDIRAAFTLMNQAGALIVHDCLPENSSMATPYPPEPFHGQAWQGVTYKAFLDFVLSHELSYETVDTDYGCGIIAGSGAGLTSRDLPPANLVEAWRTTGSDFQATYHLLEQHRDELLNVRSVETFLQRLWFGVNACTNGSAMRPPLYRKDNIVGCVDVASLEDNGCITITGWAFDKSFCGAPVWVLSLSEGEVVLETSTAGARPDVTQAFPEHAPKNVRFSGLSRPLPLQSDRRILTLAVNRSGEFAIIGNNSISVQSASDCLLIA